MTLQMNCVFLTKIVSQCEVRCKQEGNCDQNKAKHKLRKEGHSHGTLWDSLFDFLSLKPMTTGVLVLVVGFDVRGVGFFQP